jgi:hypothetical protein
MSIEKTVQLERRIDNLQQLVARLVARVVLLEQVNPEIAMPEECRTRTCPYFRNYLGQGGPEITHDQYHATEAAYQAHGDVCTGWRTGRECPQCLSYERRLRA